MNIVLTLKPKATELSEASLKLLKMYCEENGLEMAHLPTSYQTVFEEIITMCQNIDAVSGEESVAEIERMCEDALRIFRPKE